MVKCKSLTSQSKKNCFGTKEYSQNSGICNRCKSQDACGKIQARRG